MIGVERRWIEIYAGVSGITIVERGRLVRRPMGQYVEIFIVIGRTGAAGGSSTVGTPVIGRITVDVRA